MDEVSPFLERFFEDDTVIRIPFKLGKYIGIQIYFIPLLIY